MGYNLLINGMYWGYNPFTNHLLTSWDILPKLTAGSQHFRKGFAKQRFQKVILQFPAIQFSVGVPLLQGGPLLVINRVITPPYKWVPGVIDPINGVITPLISGRGPPFMGLSWHTWAPLLLDTPQLSTATQLQEFAVKNVHRKPPQKNRFPPSTGELQRNIVSEFL